MKCYAYWDGFDCVIIPSGSWGGHDGVLGGDSYETDEENLD